MPAGILRIPFSLLRVCTDTVFPPVCPGCKSPLPRESAIACQACRGALVPVDEWDEAYREALAGLTDGGTVRDFVAAWYFDREGPIRALIHSLKYGGMTSIGVELGRTLGERICEAGLGECDFIVPLPLHPSRRRERGYNQSDYVARGVTEVTGRPVRRDLIRRTRFTPSQTPLSHRERRENVSEAFTPRRDASRGAAGKSVLLVDDVLTTGATMRACAAALRRAGARSVIACAVAIAR